MSIDPFSGRPKIAKEELDDMQCYLRAASLQDISIREEIIKIFCYKSENDYVAQKTVLRLEPAPILISDADNCI